MRLGRARVQWFMDEQEMAEQSELGADALAALQQVTGMDADALAAMMASRMAAESSSDEEEGEAQEAQEGDARGLELDGHASHAEYYKAMFPERYEAQGRPERVLEKPRAVLSMEDEYVQNLLVQCFAESPRWSVTTERPALHEEGQDAQAADDEPAYHMHWGEYEHIDWFSPRFVAEDILVSCYYNRKGLIRKGNLAHILEKWRAKHPDRKPLAPKSYVLSLDAADTAADLAGAVQSACERAAFPGFAGRKAGATAAEEGVWILKPSVTNQANGICLASSQAELEEAIGRADELQLAGDFVLQQYLPPLLLDGRKFHLRVFMLLYGSLTAYVSPDFLAIFSLEQYQGATLEETRAHLTNISHQEVLSKDDQHRCMRLFEETREDMVAAGCVADEAAAAARIDEVRTRVYRIIAETMDAVSSELTFQSRSNCFELFGLDFMVDPEWGVWLLEANAEPDLSKAGDRLQGVIDNILRDTLTVVTDRTPRLSGKADGAAKTAAFSMADGVSPPESVPGVSLVKVFERTGRAW